MKDLGMFIAVIAIWGINIFVWMLLLNNPTIREFIPLILGSVTALLTGVLVTSSPQSWHRMAHFLFTGGGHASVDCPECGHRIDMKK